MRKTRLHHDPTTLEIMDHVLGKGIVVQSERDDDATGRRRAIDSIGLFGIDAHVEVVIGALKNASGA